MTRGSTKVQSRLKRLLGVVTAAMLAVAAVGCDTGSGEGSTGSSDPSRPSMRTFMTAYLAPFKAPRGGRSDAARRATYSRSMNRIVHSGQYWTLSSSRLTRSHVLPKSFSPPRIHKPRLPGRISHGLDRGSRSSRRWGSRSAK